MLDAGDEEEFFSLRMAVVLPVYTSVGNNNNNTPAVEPQVLSEVKSFLNLHIYRCASLFVVFYFCPHDDHGYVCWVGVHVMLCCVFTWWA